MPWRGRLAANVRAGVDDAPAAAHEPDVTHPRYPPIGVLVSVHEFGHYWVARRLGFKVLRFSVGFGRPLVKFTGRDADRIEYVIAAIPLGGYVRLLDEREGPVPTEDLPRAFNRRPPLARIAVLLAGPVFNFLFAIVAYWLVFMQGVPGLKPVIGDVAPGSLAAAADLRPLDEIRSVGGDTTGTRQAAMLGILDHLVADGHVPIEVRDERGGTRRIEIVVPAGRRRALTEPGTLLDGLGFSFWYPPQPVVVGECAGIARGAPGIRVAIASTCGREACATPRFRRDDPGARRKRDAHSRDARRPSIASSVPVGARMRAGSRQDG